VGNMVQPTTMEWRRQGTSQPNRHVLRSRGGIRRLSQYPIFKPIRHPIPHYLPPQRQGYSLLRQPRRHRSYHQNNRQLTSPRYDSRRLPSLPRTCQPKATITTDMPYIQTCRRTSRQKKPKRPLTVTETLNIECDTRAKQHSHTYPPLTNITNPTMEHSYPHLHIKNKVH